MIIDIHLNILRVLRLIAFLNSYEKVTLPETNVYFISYSWSSGMLGGIVVYVRNRNCGSKETDILMDGWKVVYLELIPPLLISIQHR